MKKDPIKLEKVSKIEAARRQLDTAIYLFFNDMDSISVYALVCASIDILKDLSKDRGLKLATEEFKNTIKPEYQGMFLKMINDPKNFFKHANQKPNSVLNFYPLTGEPLLFIACVTYAQFTNDSTRNMELMCLWEIIHNPQYIQSPPGPDPLSDWLKKGKKTIDGRNISKKEYYKLFNSDVLSKEFDKHIKFLKILGAKTKTTYPK